METAARSAIMTEGLVMSASIATVIDRRPEDRRTFGVQKFAGCLLGAVHKRMTARL